MVVSYKNELYMSGGRDNSGFGFNSDVWRSSNGTSWEIAASQPFEAWVSCAYVLSVVVMVISRMIPTLLLTVGATTLWL